MKAYLYKGLYLGPEPYRVVLRNNRNLYHVYLNNRSLTLGTVVWLIPTMLLQYPDLVNREDWQRIYSIHHTDRDFTLLADSGELKPVMWDRYILYTWDKNFVDGKS